MNLTGFHSASELTGLFAFEVGVRSVRVRG